MSGSQPDSGSDEERDLAVDDVLPAGCGQADASAGLQEFVAGLSHQLKTPLTAIIGLTDTLLQKPEISASTQQQFLQKIGDQARRLSSVLDDLITLSALQSTNDLALAPIDLRVPLAAAAQDLAPQAEAKGLTLEIGLPVEEVTVRGDHGALRTMVSNLLDNAIKYTRYGGHVLLRVDRKDNRAVVQVTDTGVGIEAEELDKVFERFYRGSGGRAGGRKGTGLGLSIVRQIAQIHGGRVRLSSVHQEGSTFAIELPLAPT